MKELKKALDEKIGELEEGILCMGGDFNTRIGEEGRKWDVEEEKELKRKSKDKVTNSEGMEMLRMVEDRGWEIGNGNIVGDEEGEWTYVGGRGASVIDYVVMNQSAIEKIGKLKIGARIESDHQPLELTIEEERERRKEKDDEVLKEIVKWDEESIRKYEENSKEIRIKGESAEEIWKNLREGVEKCLVRKKVRERKKRIGEKDWWYKECKSLKNKAKKAYRKWRENKRSREEYVKLRSEFRRVCKEKETEEIKKFEEEVKNLKTEKQIWNMINKGRKEKKPIDENISMEEWEEHFAQLLEGSKENEEERVKKAKSRKKRKDQEEELKDEEIEEQIRKLKKKKAAGKDGITNEAWIYSGGKIMEKLKELLKRVWRGEGFPEEWREGVITPIHKKGERERAENYRGVTLLSTAYKIYAGVLTEKLRAEIKMKEALQETQAGFREGRGTMDNVYILQHVVKKELERKGGKIYGFFMDLKAALDKVDREELWKALEEREIRNTLIERIKEIYKSTKSAVRVRGKMSNWFWTEKGVRQGCPLSPVLFSLLIADVERKGDGERTDRRSSNREE